MFDHTLIQGPHIIVKCVKNYKSAPKTFWMVGERHTLQGSCASKPHINVKDAIVSFANDNPNMKVRVFIECTMSEAYIYRQVRDWRYLSPAQEIGVLAADENLPKNIDVVFGNVRRTSIFFPFEIIYDVKSFLTFKLDVDRSFPEDVKRMRPTLRAFEKTVFKKLSSRQACKQFLEELVIPSFEDPEWYVRLCKTLQTPQGTPLVDIANPVKAVLRKVQEKDPGLYDAICMFVRGYWDDTLTPLYTPAISKADRVVGKQNVAEKAKTLSAFFTSLYSVIQDVYMLCDMWEARKKRECVYVAVVGSAHVRNVATILRNHFSSEEPLGAVSSDGCVDMRVSTHISTTALQSIATASSKNLREFIAIPTAQLNSK